MRDHFGEAGGPRSWVERVSRCEDTGPDLPSEHARFICAVQREQRVDLRDAEQPTDDEVLAVDNQREPVLDRRERLLRVSKRKLEQRAAVQRARMLARKGRGQGERLRDLVRSVVVPASFQERSR